MEFNIAVVSQGLDSPINEIYLNLRGKQEQ